MIDHGSKAKVNFGRDTILDFIDRKHFMEYDSSFVIITSTADKDTAIKLQYQGFGKFSKVCGGKMRLSGSADWTRRMVWLYRRSDKSRQAVT